MMCQMGGCAQEVTRALKLHQVEELCEKYEVDGAGLLKLNINWQFLKASHKKDCTPAQCLQNKEFRLTTANIKWKTVKKHQPGGVGIICKGN